MRLLAAILVILVSTAPLALAADVPYYDNTPGRERTMNVSDVSSGQLYSTYPVYIEYPSGQRSFSTPTVVGNTIYEYTYDSSGHGYLYATPVPSLSASYKARYVSAGQTAMTFDPGVSSGPYSMNYAAGQDSLSTNSGYQAIAVGHKLYFWRDGSMPSSPPTGVDIPNNIGNTMYQVDMSPLVTPPITVYGTNLNTMQSVSWTSPMAIAGSWDGGLVAWPTYTPPGDSFPGGIDYNTTKQYPNPDVAITSDPTWVGPTSVFGGDPAVAFGVADKYPHARVVLLDLETGQYKSIGDGVIAAPVADTVVYDSQKSILVVQDEYGGLYTFNLKGQLLNVYATSSWISTTNPILGQDMSLVTNSDGSQVLYAVGSGGDVLGEFDPSTLKVLAMTPPGKYGSFIESPTTVVDASGNSTLVFSGTVGHAAESNIYLQGVGVVFSGGGSCNGSSGGQFTQCIYNVTGGASEYVGAIPDFGPGHWIVTWTNNDPHGRPAVVAFLPTKYAVTADVQPSDVQPGGSVTVYGYPDPPGVTYDNGKNPYAFPVGSPVEVTFYDSQGNPAGGPYPMMHVARGEWVSSPWTPPQNTSGSPETYYAVVTAVDEYGTQAQSQEVPFTVEPVANTQQNPTGIQGTLDLNCYGTKALTYPHGLSNCMYGDWISGTLTIPTPEPPKGLQDAQVTAVTLTATMPYTRCYPNIPGEPMYNAASTEMFNCTTFTATLVPKPGQGNVETVAELSSPVVESWAGFPANKPPGTVYDQRDLTVEWKAVVDYTYKVRVPPYSTCVSPPPDGVQPNCNVGTGSAGVSEPVYNYATKSGSYTETGYAQTQVTVMGSDWYIITTPYGF